MNMINVDLNMRLNAHLNVHRIMLCQMSCYICYKLFYKVAKDTTPLFGQVITTKVYTLIHKQTERSISPQGLRFV